MDVSRAERVASEAKHFDAMAEKYDNSFGYSPEKRQRKLDWLADACQLSEGKIAVELGCGTGLSTQEFAKHGAAMHAVDISWRMLKLALDSRQYPNSAYEVADAGVLPFPSESFDAVIGTFILHHIELDVVISEIHRICKPGARIAFSEPNMLNPLVALIKHVPAIKAKMGESPDETAYFRWTLERQLREVGFDEINIVPIEFMPSTLPKPVEPALRQLGYTLEKLPAIKEFGGTLLISARRI